MANDWQMFSTDWRIFVITKAKLLGCFFVNLSNHDYTI